MPKNIQILKLTLKKMPFEVMVSGEKCREFRSPGRWIESRLFNKDGTPRCYDAVEFTNGYGQHRPRFLAEYRGVKKIKAVYCTYSNGLVVKSDTPLWVIYLGSVLQSWNT